nr:DUF5915 domain-containing protein [Melioribacteraceae bacterium]
AYQTLYECLLTISKLSSPFAPMISEEIYKNLNDITKLENYESVHLVDFPKPSYSDLELEEKMDIAQRIVYLTRAMRAKSNLKVRLPLKKIIVALEKNKRTAVESMVNVILDEVNIKELEVLDDEASIVNKSAKANFKVIGPKYGKLVKDLGNRIKELNKEEISELEKEGKLTIKVADTELTIGLDEVEILSSNIEGWLVETDNGITVAIDTELSEELIAEGYSREFVNRVQNLRKDNGLDIIDRIKILYTSDKKLVDYVQKFSEYICNETLADGIFFEEQKTSDSTDFEIVDFNCSIRIEKIEK